MCSYLAGLAHEGFDRHVGAEIVHLEAVGLEHGPDQGLADVVQIALHRADHHLAFGLVAAAGRGEHRADHRHRRLHGLGALHPLREEVLAFLPEPADLADPGREAGLHGGEQIDSAFHRGLAERASELDVPGDDRIAHLFEGGNGHGGSSVRGRKVSSWSAPWPASGS